MILRLNKKPILIGHSLGGVACAVAFSVRAGSGRCGYSFCTASGCVLYRVFLSEIQLEIPSTDIEAVSHVV